MIGILGGTFDPIHHGHLRTALEVAEHFSIQDMRLIPGKTPPHRPQPLSTPEQRLAMLQLAVQHEASLQADDRELMREGYSYTFDTLFSLRETMPKEQPLLFTLGVDAFEFFQKWHRWQEILQLAHLVVVHRPGYSLPPNGWYSDFWTNDKHLLQQTPAGKIYGLAVTPLDISATQIREALKLGQNPRYLLPDSVLDYICNHQLYTVKLNGT